MPLYFFQKFSHVPIWIPVKQTGFVRCSLINCFFRLFHWKELSAAEASSQTQKTFVLTLSELFQEILYAYDTKPIGWFLLIKKVTCIGFLHFWRNTSFFFIRNPSALVKRKI